MPTQRKKMTPHVPWLKPSTKVTIYNEGVESGGGHRKEWGQSELHLEATPLAPPLKGTKPDSVIYKGSLSPGRVGPWVRDGGGAWDGVRVGRHGQWEVMEER